MNYANSYEEAVKVVYKNWQIDSDKDYSVEIVKNIYQFRYKNSLIFESVVIEGNYDMHRKKAVEFGCASYQAVKVNDITEDGIFQGICKREGFGIHSQDVLDTNYPKLYMHTDHGFTSGLVGDQSVDIISYEEFKNAYEEEFKNFDDQFYKDCFKIFIEKGCSPKQARKEASECMIQLDLGISGFNIG